MTLEYTYNGGSLTHKVAPTSLSLPARADRGNIEEGSLVIEDPDADLTLVGLKPFHVEESACSQPRLFTGYLGARGIGRSYGAGQFVGASARVHEATVYDLNAVFMFRLITGSDGKRPEETWDERLAWILGSDYLDGLIEDTGHLLTSSQTIEAADYRKRYPIDVLNDLVDRTGGVTNFYAWWDPAEEAVSLWFQSNDAAESSSSLRISNVASDVDGSTTFPPDAEARLERRPTDVYSTVAVEFADGKSIIAKRAATASAFTERGTTISRPYTGKSSTATAQGNAWLVAHAYERDVITCSIKVPRDKVGLVTAGQRIEAKFSHLPGLSSFTWLRVTFSRPTPVDDAAKFYIIELELEPQRIAADGSCTTPGAWEDSDAYGATATAYTDTGLTPGDLGNVTDGTSALSAYAAGVWGGATGVYYRGWSVDLGSVKRIGTVTMIHDPNAGSGTLSGRATELAYSADGSSWTSVANAFAVQDDPDPWDVEIPGDSWTWDPSASVTARYLRVWQWITLNGYYNGANLEELLVAACDDDVDVTDPGTPLGAWVESETPTPATDGSTTTFTLANGYLPGTLLVYVDNLNQTAAVTESDPAAGEFTLAFAPYASEQVRAYYRVG